MDNKIMEWIATATFCMGLILLFMATILTTTCLLAVIIGYFVGV